MGDIRSVLSMYKRRDDKLAPEKNAAAEVPTLSEVPDVFIDEVLPHFKLNRHEIALLMYLHRQVWSRPNLYRDHGIGPLNSYQELARLLHLNQDELMQALRALEGMRFIQTIRAGQYFVRKYFTEENDAKFGQRYEF